MVMKTLPTWRKRSEFTYSGSVQDGTRIYYGSKPWEAYVSAEKYQELLRHFKEKGVPCGASRDEPPSGSLGEWLQQNVTKTAIASYVGSILIHEGYAIQNGSKIIFRGL